MMTAAELALISEHAHRFFPLFPGKARLVLARALYAAFNPFLAPDLSGGVAPKSLTGGETFSKGFPW